MSQDNGLGLDLQTAMLREHVELVHPVAVCVAIRSAGTWRSREPERKATLLFVMDRAKPDLVVAFRNGPSYRNSVVCTSRYRFMRPPRSRNTFGRYFADRSANAQQFAEIAVKALLEDFAHFVVTEPLHDPARKTFGLIGVRIGPVPLRARKAVRTSLVLKRIERGCSGFRISISATFSGSIEEWYWRWYA